MELEDFRYYIVSLRVPQKEKYYRHLEVGFTSRKQQLYGSFGFELMVSPYLTFVQLGSYFPAPSSWEFWKRREEFHRRLQFKVDSESYYKWLRDDKTF